MCFFPHWTVLTIHKQNSVFFSSITFSKNFKLTIKNINFKLPIESKAIYPYTSSHCATSPPFFPSTASAAIFFVATPSNWWFGIHNWWSSPIGKAMGTWITQTNPSSIQNKFPRIAKRLIWIAQGFFWSGMTTRKPLRSITQTPPLEYMYTDDLLSDSWSSSVHLCAHSGVPSSSNTTKPVANRQSSADQQHLREGQTMVWVMVINPHWNPETNGSMGKLWSSIPIEILKKI